MFSQEPLAINLTPEQEKEFEDMVSRFPGGLIRGGHVVCVAFSKENTNDLSEKFNINELQSFSAVLGGYWTPTEAEAEEVLSLFRKAHHMENCTQ